jgi:hypothetical protein
MGEPHSLEYVTLCHHKDNLLAYAEPTGACTCVAVPTLEEWNALRSKLAEVEILHVAAARSADAAEAKLAEVEGERDGYREQWRVKADCYDGVCRALGIESDVLGYVRRAEARAEALEGALERYGVHECDALPHSPCTCGLSSALEGEQTPGEVS